MRVLIYQSHAYAKSGEDAAILKADHSCSNDSQGAWQMLEVENVVAKKDALAIERDVLRLCGCGACGDHNVGRSNLPVAPTVGVVHHYRVWVHKRRFSGDDLHTVSL